MIPLPITSLTMSQEFEMVQYKKALQSLPEESMRKAMEDLIKQNFIYKANVANLTEYIINKGL